MANLMDEQKVSTKKGKSNETKKLSIKTDDITSILKIDGFKIGKESLFIFDIDDTLVSVDSYYDSNLSKDELLLDKNTINVLKHIQKESNLMCLTAREPYALAKRELTVMNYLPSIESILSKDKIKIFGKQIPKHIHNKSTSYSFYWDHGCLYASDQNKGKVLLSFNNYLSKKYDINFLESFKYVLFIDDSQYNISNMNKVFTQDKIFKNITTCSVLYKYNGL